MDNKLNSEAIEKILGNAEKNITSSADVHELELGKNKLEEGLVFEFASAKEEIVKEDETDTEPNTEDVNKNNGSKEQINLKNESAIPDIFEVTEGSNAENLVESTAKIWTTYVPRFTEVSETYRMQNDPRPKKEDKRIENKSVKAVESENANNEISSREGTNYPDPTAEIEEPVKDAVIVDMSKPDREDETDRLNVFKFSETREEDNTPTERTLEDEQEEIKRIITVSDNTPKKSDEAFENLSENKEQSAPKEYSIPDPLPENIRVVDYADNEETEDDAGPDCVAKEAPSSKRATFSEYTLPIQRDSFKDKFLDSLMSVKIRLGASLVFSVLLLAFEVLVATEVFSSSIFGIPVKPVAHVIIDYLFATCALLVALAEIIRAVKLLFNKKVVPELVLPVAFIILTVYTLTVIGNGGLYDYQLYGFMFSIIPTTILFAAYYRVDADFIAFKLVSKNGEKSIFDKKATRELPEENIALDGAVDEYKSNTARLFRASFITDFFKNARKVSESARQTLLTVGIPLGAALITAFICFFLVGGAFAAVSSLAFVFFMGVPIFSILSHKLPYHDTQLASRLEKSAAVGESAFGEFSGIDVIAFEDTEIFGEEDVNLKRFMLYGDKDNMERVMRQMCSLFSVVGGPLSGMFARALDSSVTHSPAHNPEIEADGLSGEVGGVRISAGSEEYMKRHGIAVPEANKRSESGLDTTKIMYAAEGNEVYAKFYIRYSFSEEFTMLLPQLKREGIVPLIYTRDPNVSLELLKTLTSGSDSIRIVKKLTPLAEKKVYSRVGASLVTFGDKINAINVILLSKKYRKLGERLSVSELYAMGAGAVLAAALSVFGMTGVPAFAFGAWQISWCLVLRFASKNAFLKGKRASFEIDREDKK